jgi:hypothetical protein
MGSDFDLISERFQGWFSIEESVGTNLSERI